MTTAPLERSRLDPPAETKLDIGTCPLGPPFTLAEISDEAFWAQPPQRAG